MSSDTPVWEKRYDGSKIWWKNVPGVIGEFVFSFDKKREYNLFQDYDKLTPEQRKLVDAENPLIP